MDSRILLFICLCISVCSAGYNLKYNYGPNEISNFNYFTGADPTHGYVFYASQQQARDWGYVYQENGKLRINSDSSSVSSGSGRGSVRLESKETFTKGLFLFDIAHMPWGQGTWPAVWTCTASGWPVGGEIDVLEGVNSNANNQMTLHTNPGCTVPTTQDYESGVPQGGNCDVYATGNSGCAIIDWDSWSYGKEFNNHGGGVYAMQWEDSGIYIWFFTRGSIPADISNGAPNPANWGKPRGRFTFNQGCQGSAHFYGHRIIIDNTFCGDWAGSVYPGGNDACKAFVQNNPAQFKESYWLFNSIKVYQQ